MPEVPQPVVHTPPVHDVFHQPAGEAPRAPFEAMGAEVLELSWQNRGIARSRFPMHFTDAANPRLQAFRKKYDFLKAIEGVEDDWEQVLRLRDWVHRALNTHKEETRFFIRPYPDGEGGDVFRLLDTAGTGRGWWCPHYSGLFAAVLVACGKPARHVGNVSNYDPKDGSYTHGVTDVFVQRFGKWVQVDAQFDVHYEKDGVPLHPYELGDEWARNGGKDVAVCVGLEKKVVPNSGFRTINGAHESSRALWNTYRWHLDPFVSNGSWFGGTGDQFALIPVGSRHEGIVCRRGQGEGNEIDQAYFTGKLQYTTRLADCYPDLGTACLNLAPGRHKGIVEVRVGTFTPNLDAIEVKFNEKRWSDQGTRFDWYPHVGENVLRVRTRDAFGNRGMESSVRAVLKKK